MARKTINVDNLGNFEFWLGIYKPRTKAWQRQRLRELKSGKTLLGEQEPEKGDKIKALKFLLGRN